MTLRRLVLPVALLLSAAAAHAQPRVDWSQAETVHLLMVDDSFVPDRLTFRHGVPYQLHLQNRGKDLHEFTAPEFLADTIVRDPGVLTNGGKEVVVQPGTSADVFLIPVRPGTFRLYCADHDWDGMVGEIIVE